MANLEQGLSHKAGRRRFTDHPLDMLAGSAALSGGNPLRILAMRNFRFLGLNVPRGTIPKLTGGQAAGNRKRQSPESLMH